MFTETTQKVVRQAIEILKTPAPGHDNARRIAREQLSLYLDYAPPVGITEGDVLRYANRIIDAAAWHVFYDENKLADWNPAGDESVIARQLGERVTQIEGGMVAADALLTGSAYQIARAELMAELIEVGRVMDGLTPEKSDDEKCADWMEEVGEARLLARFGVGL